MGNSAVLAIVPPIKPDKRRKGAKPFAFRHTVEPLEARRLAVRSMGRKRPARVPPDTKLCSVEVFETHAGRVVVATLCGDRDTRVALMGGEVVGEFDAYVSVMVFLRDLDRAARCLPPRDADVMDPDDRMPRGGMVRFTKDYGTVLFRHVGRLSRSIKRGPVVYR